MIVSRWGRYGNFEGPFYMGTLKVSEASQNDSFVKKILTITTSAEGGAFDAINMYDSGLLSVGAIQFIDAGQFHVANMFGRIADVDYDNLIAKLKPALDVCKCTFQKQLDGQWRFVFDNGKPIVTTVQQKILYFGDANGNLSGTFTKEKIDRSKIWTSVAADVWTIPGAIDIQLTYTFERIVKDFTWGSLRKDLFVDNTEETGLIGLTKAMLVGFAVNSPAVVMNRYEKARNNKYDKYSDDWCFQILKDVVVGAGISIWKTRWNSNIKFTMKCFGINMPTFEQMSIGDWSKFIGQSVQIQEEKIAEIVTGITDVQTFESTSIPQVEQKSKNILDLVFDFVQFILKMLLRK